jgi:hypothetical protein
MLFDKELKDTFKERSQLHRILEGNTWVFGEEFALTVWLVVNDMDEYVRKDSHTKDKPEGLLWESPDLKIVSKVWVKTWAQVIRDCRTRLKIFQKALDITASADAGLEYLRKTYARILLGVEPADTASEEE